MSTGLAVLILSTGCSTGDTSGDRPAADIAPPVEVLPVQPGTFRSPLVRLKRLQGQSGHLHTDEIRYRAEDKKLFQCSYTFGVVDASEPANIRYLAENIKHTIPGDERTPGCVHLAWDGDIVYTTHRGNLRNPAFLGGWDISKTDPEDPEKMKPQQIPVLQEPGVSYEGVDVADHRVFVAIRDDGLGAYEADAETRELSRVGTLGGLGSTWGVRVRDGVAYVTDITGGLSTVDVGDPTQPALLGRVELGGVPKGLALDGDHAYVAAGGEGLVVVDVADPANPAVVARAATPGPAIRVTVSDGHAFVAAWTDTRAYDVSDPTAPRLVGAVRLTTDINTFADDEHPPATARTMGIAADGRNVFVGNWWVLHSYRLYPERPAPYLLLPENVSMMDFGRVAPGERRTLTVPVRNHGTAPLALFHNWTSGPFSVTPPQVAVAPGETAMLEVTYTATPAGRETGILSLWSDDPGQPVRTAFLIANQDGLGVGQPFPETRVTLLDGSEWSSAQAAGKVLVVGYFATFCPVCSVHVRDTESQIWQAYREKGVEVVMIDANGDAMDGVQDYVKNLHVSYPLGLEDESTKTYAALTANYKGVNPFPVDVVVGRDGKIAYVVREYDPAGLMAAIETELAK